MANVVPPSHPTILYIENNPDDLEILSHALRGTRIHLMAYGELETAENYLLGHASPTASPDLVLVDFKLNAGETCLNLFLWRRHHPTLPHVPIVVFSGDDYQEFVQSCYEMGADLFLAKPAGYAEWAQLAHCLDECLSKQPCNLEVLRNCREYRQPLTAAFEVVHYPI